VARQNHTANSALFDAYDANFTMVPSHIVAQEAIAILSAPLLARFLERLRNADESWSQSLGERLQALCSPLTPAIWDIRLNISEAPGAYRALMRGKDFRLGDILRDGSERERALPILPLLLERGENIIVLPDEHYKLQAGDQLLLASSLATQRNLTCTLRNENELAYVLDGEESSSWLWRKLRRKGAGQAS